MKVSQSLFLFLLLQVGSFCSAFQVPTLAGTVTPRKKPEYTLISRRVARATLGSLALSFLPHPKLANAIGIGSRLPLPTTPGGVELTTATKQIGQTAILFIWTLFIMTALEWNGFEYFRHLISKIRNLGKEEEIADAGLAKESDWNSYSRLINLLQQQKKRVLNGARIRSLFRRLNNSKVYKQQDLQKANKFFREKQYEQHHHIVHVSRSNENRSNYLESLSSKFTSLDPDIDVSHDKSYLDTLSELKAEKTTWEDYKNKVNLVKNEQLDGGKELESKISDLQDLIQMEQSMYQTSNQALKLALDAQNQQLQHAKVSSVNDSREYDALAGEFDETIRKDMAAQKAAGLVEDDVQSIVYEL